ncbi:hypothetical protein QS460_04395 [Liquorilactobacillus mali]|uniref:hypothetical protein n=1 Tax=Liquorilactobacillus mali TaxID=1618 RepID=UPI00264BDDDD|nr:hypothetical protein [Liquorilactobacillus mali]MDN7145165.1 hypothetical protein [Liquorilactobacillus mali]
MTNKEYKLEDFYDLKFKKRIKVQAKIKRCHALYKEEDFRMEHPISQIEMEDIRDRKNGKLLKEYSSLIANKHVKNKFFKKGDYVEFWSIVTIYERVRVPDSKNWLANIAEELIFVNGCQSIHLISKGDAEKCIESELFQKC